MRSRIAWNSIWTVIILIVLGVFMLVGGGISYVSNKQITNRCTAVTYGIVTDVSIKRVRKHRHTKTTYIATVDPEDRSIFNSSGLRSDRTSYSYRKGEQVEINYDPLDPSTYYIQHADPSSSGMAMIITGSVITFMGIVIAFLRKAMRA